MAAGDVGTAASSELSSPGVRPEFRFPNGLYKVTKITDKVRHNTG